MAPKVTDELLDHDYDGIREYDNPLPRWWLYGFYATIVFAILYIPYYHFGPGRLPTQQYEIDLITWEQRFPPVELASADQLLALSAEPGILDAGAATFQTRCASCHAPDGGGLVGPNLADDHSIHGQTLDAMVNVVYNGVPAKGMISWRSQLTVDEIYAVTVYVASLRGATPAKPKEAQGDPIPEDVPRVVPAEATPH